MLSAEHNRLLTEVEGDAPMGRMMRERYWIPCALSETLVADGAPQRIKLLGRTYAAFRATDGRVGFFDEACPHRGVSLVLARNENCALQCIFHGWTFDVSGKVTHIPSEPDDGAAMSRHVKVKHYPTFEGAGLVWVYLGQGAPPPKPPLPFMDLPPEQLWMSRSLTPCNWFQGVEGAIDSVHVGTLHQSWIGDHQKGKANISLTVLSHPRYEVEDAPYGLRAAAVRMMPDGRQYIRVTEFLMPFICMAPGAGRTSGTVFISTPMDDHSHMLFWGIWNEDGPTPDARHHLTVGERDINNYGYVEPGPDWRFGQNREAMANGHFSGIDRSLIEEDMVVQASMGPVVDRSAEQLCATDVGLVNARRRLLEELAAFQLGEAAPEMLELVRPLDFLGDPSYDWREPA